MSLDATIDSGSKTEIESDTSIQTLNYKSSGAFSYGTYKELIKEKGRVVRYNNYKLTSENLSEKTLKEYHTYEYADAGVDEPEETKTSSFPTWIIFVIVGVVIVGVAVTGIILKKKNPALYAKFAKFMDKAKESSDDDN